MWFTSTFTRSVSLFKELLSFIHELFGDRIFTSSFCQLVVSRIFAFHFFEACVVAPKYPSVTLWKISGSLRLEYILGCLVCHWLAQMLKFKLTPEIHWDEQSFGDPLFSHLFQVTPLKYWEIIDIGTEPSHRREFLFLFLFFALRLLMPQMILTPSIPSAPLMSQCPSFTWSFGRAYPIFWKWFYRKGITFMCYTSIAKVEDVEDNYPCFTWWLNSPASCSLYLLFVRCELPQCSLA